MLRKRTACLGLTAATVEADLKCARQLSVVRDDRRPCNLLSNPLCSTWEDIVGGQVHARPQLRQQAGWGSSTLWSWRETRHPWPGMSMTDCSRWVGWLMEQALLELTAAETVAHWLQAL